MTFQRFFYPPDIDEIAAKSDDHSAHRRIDFHRLGDRPASRPVGEPLASLLMERTHRHAYKKISCKCASKTEQRGSHQHRLQKRLPKARKFELQQVMADIFRHDI